VLGGWCVFSSSSLLLTPWSKPASFAQKDHRRLDKKKVGKEGLAVCAAFKKESVVIQVYICLGVFDFPMAAKFSNSIGAQGTEHCTSCDIVHKKAVTERKERAMSSTVSFNVKYSRYSRTQK